MLIHDSIFLQIIDISHISCFIYAAQLHIYFYSIINRNSAELY